MKKELLITVVLPLVIVLGLSLWAQTASAEYSFGEWAADTGLPIDATLADADYAGITSLDGLSAYTNLDTIELSGNPLSHLTASDFVGLNALRQLMLGGNDISSIEPGTFSNRHSLFRFSLDPNPLVGLFELTGAQVRDLTFFSIRSTAVDDVDLTNAELSQLAFNGIMGGGGGLNRGLASAGIIEMNLTGADLSDVEQLNVLYNAHDLQQLNLANVTFASSIINDTYDEVVQLIVSLEADTLNFLTIDMDVYLSHQSYFDDWDSVLFNELTVVPEPITISLFVLGGLALIRKRKR